MTTNLSVPSRYKRQHFDRVAPVLGQALREFPGPVRFVPHQVSVETFSRMFREALEAKRLFGYDHPAVDNNSFVKHAHELRCGMRAGFVIIGTAERIKQHPIALVAETSEQLENEIVLIGLDDKYLDAVCLLMAKKVIEPRPNIVVNGLSESTRTHYESKYDIGFVDLGGGRWQIV